MSNTTRKKKMKKMEEESGSKEKYNNKSMHTSDPNVCTSTGGRAKERVSGLAATLPGLQLDCSLSDCNCKEAFDEAHVLETGNCTRSGPKEDMFKLKSCVPFMSFSWKCLFSNFLTPEYRCIHAIT